MLVRLRLRQIRIGSRAEGLISMRRRAPFGLKPRGRKPWWWGVVALVIAGFSYVAKQQGWIKDDRRGAGDRENGRVERTTADGREIEKRSGAGSETSLSRAIRERRSDVLVEADGVVVKVLPDDNDGARHQRLLVRVGDDTVLIAHNIDLAPRAPAKEGDAIRFKGEFDWNDRGGAVHWTHHDPAKWRPGGWVEVKGKRYE